MAEKKKSLVIYGLGSFAKLMSYYFTTDSDYDVVAFCADEAYIESSVFDGLPVIPFTRLKDEFGKDEVCLFVAVGYSSMRARDEMFKRAKMSGYRLVNYVSSKATVDSSLSMGVNNAVFQGACIEPFCAIGDNNIIWSSVTVCHDVIIKQNVFLASSTVVGGFSVIEEGSFLGFRTTVTSKVVIGKESLVGAGSLVLKNTEPYSKNIGTPARHVDSHYSEGVRVNE